MVNIKKFFEMECEDNHGQRLSAVGSYYRSRSNVSIISFGNAGYRIMKSMGCLEVKNTVNISVIDREYIGLRGFYNGKLSYDDKSIDIMLSSKSRDTNPFRSPEAVYIKKIYVGPNLDDNARKVYELSNPSISYILVSGFGGKFAQPQHLKFLRLLKTFKKTVLNAIIIPSYAESNARNIAMEGLSEIISTGSPFITFRNEIIKDPRPENSIIEDIEEANMGIARRIEEYAERISSSIDELKYALIKA